MSGGSVPQRPFKLPAGAMERMLVRHGASALEPGLDTLAARAREHTPVSAAAPPRLVQARQSKEER